MRLRIAPDRATPSGIRQMFLRERSLVLLAQDSAALFLIVEKPDVTVTAAVVSLFGDIRCKVFDQLLWRNRDLFRVGILGFWIGFDVRLTRAHLHAEFFACEGEFVTGQQCPSQDSLSVHFRAVRAAQIANEKQAVGSDDQTMHLGDTGRFQADVTQVILSTDECDIPCNLNWSSTSLKRD